MAKISTNVRVFNAVVMRKVKAGMLIHVSGKNETRLKQCESYIALIILEAWDNGCEPNICSL